jgi:glucose/arabinose dehydrogenase
MKKLALLVSLLLVAGVASAAQSTPAQPAPAAPAAQSAAPAQPAQPATKTHTVEAEVVSADATAKTLTIKGEKENKTVTVDAAAVGSLKTLKSGDKVKLTCRDSATGQHEAVTEIKVEKGKIQ